MMDYACSYTLCQEPVAFMCLCTEGPVYLCLCHKGPHRLSPTGGKHIIKDNKKYLLPEKKSQLNEYLSSRLNYLKKQQKSMHAFLKEVLDMFELTFNALETQIYHLTKKLTEISTLDHSTLLTRLIIDQEEDCLDLTDIIRDEEYLMDKLSRKFKEKDIRDSVEDLFNKYWEHSNHNLHIFRTGTTVLAEVNPIILSQKEMSLSLDFIQGIEASVCQLPNNRLFYSFGIADNNTFIEKTLIIDLNTRKVDVYPAPRSRKNAAAVLVNNKVYVFGGCYKSEMAFCDMFDLEYRKWVQIEKLPNNGADNTSALLVGDKILITGFNSKIFLFEYQAKIFNIYSAININVQRNNLLVLDNERIILISRSVFITNADLKSQWERKGAVLDFGIVSCSPVTRGRLVFFICADYKIYQFDLDSCSLYNIGSLA